MLAVYPYKLSPTNELRYSLRSLDHNAAWCTDVVLIGDQPEWYTGTHIGVHDGATKIQSAQARIRVACALAPEWVLMNDDFFVMQPTIRPPLLHWKPLGDMVAGAGGRYRAAIKATMQIVGPDFPAAALHCPVLVRSDVMLRALEICAGEAMHRTVYAWLAKEPTEFSEDRKAFRDDMLEEMIDGPWFSTKDATAGERFEKLMAERFPNPSRWERQ